MKRYIRWFHEQEARSPELVGGEAVNLSRLATAGFAVPPGFCVTAQAYCYLLDVTGLRPVIARLLQHTDFNDPDEVDRQARSIRELIIQQPMPTDIARQIVDAYQQLALELGTNSGERLGVAVRSSVTAEELPGASFAGQLDSYLNVRGGNAVLERVHRCWASLWTARAVTDRQRQGFDHNKIHAAVVVRAMIEAETAGILFTANPSNGRRHECVINASWGLGGAIVSGVVTPDTFVVSKHDGQVLERRVATKKRMIVYARDGGVREVATPLEKQQQPALDSDGAARLAALGSRVEAFCGQPQEIAWANRDGNWYILQVRPITTLEQGTAEEKVEPPGSSTRLARSYVSGA